MLVVPELVLGGPGGSSPWEVVAFAELQDSCVGVNVWLSRSFALPRGATIPSSVGRRFRRAEGGNGSLSLLSRVQPGKPLKKTLWKGFSRKSRLEIATFDFPMKVDARGHFLRPPVEALGQGGEFMSRQGLLRRPNRNVGLLCLRIKRLQAIRL